MSRGSSSLTRSKQGGTLKGFAAILLWSATIALVRSMSEELGPVTAGAAVYSVSGAIAAARLFLVPARRRRMRCLPRPYLVVCGFFFVAYMFLIYIAVGLAGNRQQALEVGMLNYLWPALTVLLSVPLLGKRARWTLAPGTLLALFGVFLVLTQEGAVSWKSVAGNLAANPAPYALGAGAGLSWALYSALTGRWAQGRDAGAVDLFLPATAAFLLLAAVFTDENGAWTARAALEAAFLGIATYVAYEFWDSAMRTGNVVAVASASYFTPLLSTAVSCLYLAVALSFSFWLGAGLLVAGSLLSWRSVLEPGLGKSRESV